ncbi:MAG: serine hydroxymethyltransferase [Bacilli bacterium]|nr:serine hydroxymethyltransferase [Bacilli bacterium]MBO6286285.1 serine hydroxymethyltransferase [Bacilli bacterium]
MDYEIKRLEELELQRQNEGIELIASENYPSVSVREAQGSIFTAKYAEGYPGRRYYGGCVVVDELENLAIERCKKLFNVAFANVQPHSGSQANFAAYRALLQPNGKVLSLTLNDGGHLTHGSGVSFSANTYNFCFYPLGEDAHLDYNIIREKLFEEKPDLLLAGYSAYPYAIDFKRMRELVDEYNKATGSNCRFMVDMAHIAGQVAAGKCQNPCDYADVVTSTTHKTLRGPRGGLILTNDPELAKKINSAVFPYSQGGPLEHVIAAKATVFAEDDTPEFKAYFDRVLENTKACNDELARLGCMVSGTENHLFLLNVLGSFGVNGLEAQTRLEEVGITTNKNMLHGDTLSPKYTSGIRVGFAAATSRGCTKQDAEEIAHIIYETLSNPNVDVEAMKARSKKIASKWTDISKLEY